MELVMPSAAPTSTIDGVAILKAIELAGRTCYKSEERISEGTAMKFVRGVIERGHESVIEHYSLSARIICDRGVSHEIVRHRLASYSQESTRYCNYGSDDIQFIRPPWFSTLKPGVYALTAPSRQVCFESSDCIIDKSVVEDGAVRWLRSCLESEEHYKWLIGYGQKPQQARAVLTNSLKTEIVMTANLREWRHFFKLRCSKAAHPQMREVALQLLNEFAAIPVVFEDIMHTVFPVRGDEIVSDIPKGSA